MKKPYRIAKKTDTRVIAVFCTVMVSICFPWLN